MIKNIRMSFVLLLIEACLLLNIFLIPSLFMIYIFTGIYVLLIYFRFAENVKSLVYYSTILFALVFLCLYMPIGDKFSIYYFYISTLLYLIIHFTLLIKNKENIFERYFHKNKYDIFPIIFIPYLAISFLLAANKTIAGNYMIIYFIMLSFVFMLINENKTEKNIAKTLKFLEYVYCGILFLGITEMFGVKYGLRNHFWDYGVRFSGVSYTERIPVVFFYNPNNYAVFLVLAMIFIFVTFVFAKSKGRRVWLGSLYLISQINLIFTKGRTGWASIFIELIFALLLILIFKVKPLEKPTIKFIVSTLMVFILLSLIPFMAPFYGKIIKKTPVRTNTPVNIKTVVKTKAEPVSEDIVKLGDTGSVNQRYTILYDVFKGVVLKGHILGFGPGNTQYYVQSIKNTHGVINIHSLLFEILGDFGIPMCLYSIYIYLCLIIDLIKGSIVTGKIKNHYAFMLGLNLFGFIFLSFAPSTVITFTTFWLILGLSLAVVKNEELKIKN